MPQLDGTQMRIGGEILDMSYIHTSTVSTVEVGSTYQDLDRDLVLSFKSDRTGYVEIACSFYIDKTTDTGSGDIILRLVDEYDNLVIGTVKDCVNLPDSIIGQMVHFSWGLSVTQNTLYNFKPQLKTSSSQTLKLVYGGNKSGLFLRAIGI